MQPDKFTVKSQEAIQAAQKLAHERGNPEITPEHLLTVMLEQEGSIVVPVLNKVGVDPNHVRAQVAQALDKLSSVSGAAASESRPSGELVRVFQDAESEADALKDEFISTEHLLMALSDSQGPAGEIAALGRSRPRRDPRGAGGGARAAPRHRPQPRGQVPGAGEIRPRPDRGRRAGQARSGDRPRRGDPARDPGACRGAPRTTRC